MTNEDSQKIIKEVQDLHAFFEAWFNGTLNSEEFIRVEKSIAVDMKMVSPEGVIMSGEGIIQAIKNSHGSSNHIKIWVEDVTVKRLTADFYLATYYELQDRAGNNTKRYSSAIFRRSSRSPNDFEWIHVHETWVK